MAGDHVIDALGHDGKVASEAFDRHEDVDIALVVLDRHGVHFSDQAAQIGAQGLDRFVDESLLARELFERRLEIAFAEGLDASHGLLLDGDVPATMSLMPLAMLPKSPWKRSEGTKTSISPLSCSTDILLISAIRPRRFAAQRFDGLVDEGLLAGNWSSGASKLPSPKALTQAMASS